MSRKKLEKSITVKFINYMKKIYLFGFAFLIFLLPHSAGAVVQSLNGLTGQNQSFVNDTNVTMSHSGTNHTYSTNTTVHIGEDGIPGCIVMGDSDSSGVTYITANNGVLSASTTTPSNCN